MTIYDGGNAFSQYTTVLDGGNAQADGPYWPPIPGPALPASTLTIGSLTLNTIDGNGTAWAVQKFDGWGASVPTLTPVQNVRRSGYTMGDSFSAGRVMTLTIMVMSADPVQHSIDCDTLISTFSRVGDTLYVSESGRTRSAFIRRSAEIVPTHYSQIATSFVVQVTSPDWRKFGTPVTGTTLLPSSTGGFSYPMSYPFDIPASVASGAVTLTNPGNEVGPVWVRIDGPCIGGVVTHESTGAQLVFSTSLVLGPGEFLTVDMEKRSVLANGQSSRNAYVTSRGWSGFYPGPNTWLFSAPTFNAASRLTVTATPSWE